jgi:hypothetical protein
VVDVEGPERDDDVGVVVRAEPASTADHPFRSRS